MIRVKKWLTSKTAIITAGMILAGYLVLILVVTNLGQSRLEDSRNNELHLKISHYVNALSYFLKTTKDDLEVLAADKTMLTYFSNRSSGMSMQYGLGSSLFSLQRRIKHLLSDSEIDNIPVYKRLVLLDFGKNVIVDSDTASPLDIAQIPFQEMHSSNSKTIVVDTPDGLIIKMLTTIYQQQKAVAILIADINTELIVQQLTAMEYSGSGSHLLLSTPNGNIFIWDSLKSIKSPVEAMLPHQIYIEEAVNGTPFKLRAWFEGINEKDLLTSDWFVIAISMLAFPVMLGFFYLIRVDQRNAVLQTQIEVSAQQQEKLTQKNKLLLTEIKKRKMSQNRLAYQATHDALTGLVNRSYSLDHLKQAIYHSQRDGTQILVMFIDLDNFKNINDTLGHHAGDQILKDVGFRLTTSVRNTDTVARLGGDEFLLIIPELADSDSAKMLAGKILTLFKNPFEIEEQEFFLSTSIGMATYPQDGLSPDELLKNADMALYRVKEEGRNGFSFYDSRMNDALQRSLVLNHHLHLAISSGEIEMYYQPIIDLKTRKIVAAEALMRWTNSKLGFISPDEFIPLAEKNGQIHALGEFALEQACCQAAEWQSIYPLQIAVNFSAVQFRYSAELLSKIETILEKSGLPASRLGVEVTESLLVNNNREFADMLARLTELGIELSLDDFGTGYSSLAYLQKFSFSKLKIDRAFVSNLETNPADLSLVTAISAMAKALKLEVVAEGIEDDFQANILSELQCAYGQGYLFSRPVTATEFTQLLLEDREKMKGLREA